MNWILGTSKDFSNKQDDGKVILDPGVKLYGKFAQNTHSYSTKQFVHLIKVVTYIVLEIQ